MTKSEFIGNISELTGITVAEADRLVNGVIAEITISLKRGEDVQITGFGTFSVSTRAARVGHNPQNGEPVDIPETNVAKFKPGKTLKDAINA